MTVSPCVFCPYYVLGYGIWIVYLPLEWSDEELSRGRRTDAAAEDLTGKPEITRCPVWYAEMFNLYHHLPWQTHGLEIK